MHDQSIQLGSAHRADLRAGEELGEKPSHGKPGADHLRHNIRPPEQCIRKWLRGNESVRHSALQKPDGMRSHDTSVLWQVTLVAESFGGCLALRCLSLAPDLFERAVLVNPATCFAESYGGLLSLAVGTNLLSIFPEQLYQVGLVTNFSFFCDSVLPAVLPAG